MNNKFREALFSIIVFSATFAATSLTQTQIIGMENVIGNIIFLTSVIGVLIFWGRSYLLNKNFLQIFGLGVLTVSIHILTYLLIIKYAGIPHWPFESYGSSFLLLNEYYVWVKPLDVLQQQLLIFLLVNKLYELGFTYINVARIFVVGFGIIHIFQIFKTEFIIGLLFTAGALMLSYVAPWMIKKSRNGLGYNYLIHLGLYNTIALFMWFVF